MKTPITKPDGTIETTCIFQHPERGEGPLQVTWDYWVFDDEDALEGDDVVFDGALYYHVELRYPWVIEQLDVETDESDALYAAQVDYEEKLEARRDADEMSRCDED